MDSGPVARLQRRGACRDVHLAGGVRRELEYAGELVRRRWHGHGDVKRGKGHLYLSAANTFTGGVLGDGSGGDIYIENSDAFGTGKVLLNDNTVNLLVNKAVTVTNDITFTGRNSEHTGSIKLCMGTPVYFTGTLDFSAGLYPRLHANGKTLYVRNLVLPAASSDSEYFKKCISPRDIRFVGAISGNGVIACDASFYHAYGTSHNTVSVDFYDASKNWKKVICTVDNVFTASSFVRFFANASDTQVFDLMGHDQILASFFTKGDAPTYKCAITNSAATTATLTAQGDQSRTFAGTLGGALSLCWNPVGNYTLTLDVPNSTMSGTLSVSNGSVTVKANSDLPKVSGICVAAGATLSFEAGVEMPRLLTRLVLQEGATISSAEEGGVTLDVESYYIADADGNLTLQHGEETFAVGTGISVKTRHQTVPSVTATWTGNGADEKMSTSENWSTAVELQAANLVATFAEQGTQARAEGEVRFKGLVLDAPGIASGDNNFYVGGDGASVSLYEEGIRQVAKTSETGGRTYHLPSVVNKTDMLWSVPGHKSYNALYVDGDLRSTTAWTFRFPSRSTPRTSSTARSPSRRRGTCASIVRPAP